MFPAAGTQFPSPAAGEPGSSEGARYRKWEFYNIEKQILHAGVKLLKFLHATP